MAMCDRKENEPMMVYLLRYIVEQPRAILALLGFVAAAYMYIDLMAFVRENTQSMREITVEMREFRAEGRAEVRDVRREGGSEVREANTRLNHLEREHEAARKGGMP
jgi:signal transduction histidine kinase